MRNLIPRATVAAAALAAAAAVVAVPAAAAAAKTFTLTNAGSSSVGVAPATSAQAGATITVLAQGLANPRGLSIAPDGGVYLAEAGDGDPTATNCVPGGEASSQTCFGFTGSFDHVSPAGTVNRIVTGLISAAAPQGYLAQGPVAASAGPGGSFYGLFGGDIGEPFIIPPPGAIPGNLRQAAVGQMSHLELITPGGQMNALADVGTQIYAWTQQNENLLPGKFPDTDVNSMVYSEGRLYAADAGADVMAQVNPGNGHVNILDYFPTPANSSARAGSSCVTRGPDGAMYVGEVFGGHFAPGYSRVWRIAPGQQPTVWATGLSHLNGCTFGPDGSFYGAELQTGTFNPTPSGDPAGDIVKIAPDGTRTHIGVGSLSFPSGVAVAADNSLYVSNCGISPSTGISSTVCPAGGQLIRITQP